jgi:hypothetical protein
MFVLFCVFKMCLRSNQWGFVESNAYHLGLQAPEQGVKLLGLLLTGSTGQQMAGRNGLA